MTDKEEITAARTKNLFSCAYCFLHLFAGHALSVLWHVRFLLFPSLPANLDEAMTIRLKHLMMFLPSCYESLYADLSTFSEIRGSMQ